MRRSSYGGPGAVVLLAALASTTGASAPLASFDPAQVTPYFHKGPAAEALRRLRLEEWAGAADGFVAYLRKRPKASDARQAKFLAAWAELRAGRFDDAGRHFDALARSYPLLGDYHRAWGARAHLAAGRASEALKRGKQVPSSSTLDGEARLLRAEALGRLSRAAESAEEYRGYLTAYPTSWRAEEVRFRLAEALRQAGQVEEASKEYRRVYLEAPAAWGKQAGAQLGAEELSGFDAASLAQRATALASAMRNQESEAEWQRVLQAPKLSEALTCTARYNLGQSVFKQRDRQRAAPLFDAAASACKQAKDDDLTTKSLYQAGRCWGSRGMKDVASSRRGIARFEELWREHPQHSYADDARLRQAEVLDSIKEEARASELLSGLPAAFPEGDQRGEALWRLAFRDWRKGDLAAARRWLMEELRLLPREEGWWEAGRTLYWLGRIAADLKDPAAPTWFARAAREYPLSYYALQALNRLKERWPDQAAALLAELTRDPGDPQGWRFAPRALYREPAFQRGLELARLGLGAEAKRELALAGIQAKAHKGAPPVEDPKEEELLWLAAVLYDRAGEYAHSHAIPRHVLTSFQRSYPLGENRRRWLIAYPRAYADLVDKHAPANGQPAALQLAIMREESAFDPLLESFANAVGLTQLTAAPAARFAQGLPHDRNALRDPVINVTIGARELGHLYGLFHQNTALTIASYNAGEGAVKRWLSDRQRGNLPLDAFVEAIPYDETRGYTKRVLASYFTYHWLSSDDAAKVPALPLSLPELKRHR